MAYSFSRTMIGGDIAGLDALSSKLTTYPPQIQGVIDAVNGRVESLIHDANWWGDAADKFKRRWEADSIRAEVLKRVVVMVAGILGDLAGILRTLENALQQAADDARAAGVPVDANGDILALPPDPTVLHAATVYAETRQYALETAQRARIQATGELQSVESVIGPRSYGEGRALPPDAWVNAADVISGLYALPSSSRRLLRSRIPKLRAERIAAHTTFSEQLKYYSKRRLPMPDDIKAQRRATLEAFNKVNSQLEKVDRWDTRLTKLMDVRLSKLAPALEVAADGSRGLRMLGEVPVVDLVAGGIVTGIATYDDMQKGDDWWTALPKEGSTQAVAIAAGAVVAGVVVVGLVVIGAPAIVVVGAAVIVGGIVACGVGDVVSNAMHEHWDEDIHKYGVAGGIGHGLADVGQNTAHDAVTLANQAGGVKDAIANKAGGIKDAIGSSGIWHGLFG